MWTAETVLVCAMEMLGRSASSLPPIELITTVPPNVSSRAEAFVDLNDRRIYLVSTSGVFQRAQQAVHRCGDTMAIRKIASIIVHEEVHLKQGPDEKRAYEAQLTMLTALGAGPGSSPYYEVQAAMLHTLARQKQRHARPTELMATATRASD